MEDAAKNLRPQFLAESKGLLAGIREFLIAVAEGQQVTVGNLRKAYRCAHTLRGTAALVKIETIRRIARLIEDVLESQIQRKQVPGRTKIELLNRALATVEEHIELIRNGTEPGPETAKAMEEAFASMTRGPAKKTTKLSMTATQLPPEAEYSEPPKPVETLIKTTFNDDDPEVVPENVCCRFQVDRWDFYLPIQNMVEIAQLPELIPLPFAPAYVRGLINLRGRVIPIIDLSTALGTPSAELSCCNVVIARTPEEELGLLADKMPQLAPEFGGEFFDLLSFVEEFGVQLPS